MGRADRDDGEGLLWVGVRGSNHGAMTLICLPSLPLALSCLLTFSPAPPPPPLQFGSDIFFNENLCSTVVLSALQLGLWGQNSPLWHPVCSVLHFRGSGLRRRWGWRWDLSPKQAGPKALGAQGL